MDLPQHPLGYLIDIGEYVVFFGNKDANIDSLKAEFSQFQFTRLRQVHSDNIVETDNLSLDYTKEADSHFTNKDSLALCSITADCTPILIVNDNKKIIAAIHAGWRGIQNQITIKTIERVSSPTDRNSCSVFIGPHIKTNSFIVDKDVKEVLIDSCPSGYSSQDEASSLSSSFLDGNFTKYRVDLYGILLKQIESTGISTEQIFTLYIDTFTDLNFHSFRRDKNLSGRQISFIAKKPK